MDTKFFIIRALTPLHAGSGEINYGLIDNLIQRDPITGLPNINASSIKGAFREHFEKVCSMEKEELYRLFGTPPIPEKEDKKEVNSDPAGYQEGHPEERSKEKSKPTRQQGRLRFFEATLLSIPCRCSNSTAPYIMVTSEDVAQRCKSMMNVFGISANDIIPEGKHHSEKGVKGAKIEDILCITEMPGNNHPEKFKDVFYEGNESFTMVDNKNLVLLTDNNHLPIISRNQLESGISANLWYEQILPRYSRLGFFVMGETEDLTVFCDNLKNNNIVQIGANATIGYGYCQVKPFSPNNNNTNTSKK